MKDATFDFRTESRGHVDLLIIVDQNLPHRKTVLMDMDRVLEQILQSLYQPLSNYLILAHNPTRAESLWWAVEFDGQRRSKCIALMETDFNRAVMKIIARDSVGEGGENITL